VNNLQLSFLGLLAATLVIPVGAKADTLTPSKFTGSPSCASTSCHGGGTLHNESVVYERRDRHAVAHGILAKGTSLRMAEALGIKDPGKAAQCTVCHAPMENLAPSRLAAGVAPDRAVGCESCHGAAEKWLLFHTRPDVTYQQILGQGLHNLNDLYNRANTCVACHLNLDESIRAAGHPELFFELDGQTIAQPPHYKDERPSLGPRSWLTGQAAALREVSWKLSSKKDERLAGRWKALVWLLRKTEVGKNRLPEAGDYAAVQKVADQLAIDAAKGLWTKDQVARQLGVFVKTRTDFGDPKTEKLELRRRAEVLVPAIDRLWQAQRKLGTKADPDFEKALDETALIARDQDGFEPAKFVASLERLEVAFSKVVN
jgi:hypothetical protein